MSVLDFLDPEKWFGGLGVLRQRRDSGQELQHDKRSFNSEQHAIAYVIKTERSLHIGYDDKGQPHLRRRRRQIRRDFRKGLSIYAPRRLSQKRKKRFKPWWWIGPW